MGGAGDWRIELLTSEQALGVVDLMVLKKLTPPKDSQFACILNDGQLKEPVAYIRMRTLGLRAPVRACKAYVGQTACKLLYSHCPWTLCVSGAGMGQVLLAAVKRLQDPEP